MAVAAYVLIQTEVGQAGKVADRVRALPGVVGADDVTGPYDVIVRCEVDSVDALGRKIVSEIQRIDGITRSSTCIVVRLD